jgi:hypothetical protein
LPRGGYGRQICNLLVAQVWLAVEDASNLAQRKLPKGASWDRKRGPDGLDRMLDQFEIELREWVADDSPAGLRGVCEAVEFYSMARFSTTEFAGLILDTLDGTREPMREVRRNYVLAEPKTMQAAPTGHRLTRMFGGQAA